MPVAFDDGVMHGMRAGHFRIRKARTGSAVDLNRQPFGKKFGYGQRALVEEQISRIKRCIGERLLTQRLESHQREGQSSRTS
ncbi:hypothetical protein [Burkholderia territorii]|uniref:hypothetical protein n=1 Tax=Burkholderia territorii TaxID=1503055 RepID=UPI0018C5BEA4|nr:hypothetical protein [Burkholderia territorii]